MAKKKQGSDGPGDTPVLTPALLEEDFGLTRDLPDQAKWINPEGEGVATPAMIEGWKQAYLRDEATLARVRQSAEATIGELLHNLGTHLRVMRGHRAWEGTDIESWPDYTEQVLKLARRSADRLVSFAGAVTREEAAFGVRKCHAGLRICKLLGLSRLGELIPKEGGRESPEWAKVLGEPVAFAASSAVRLERLAAGEKEPALPEKPTSRKVAETVVKRREAIDGVKKKYPVLEELGVRSYARNGEPRVTHDPGTTKEHFAALSAMYNELKKIS